MERLFLEDHEFAKRPLTNVRHIARGFVLNKEGKIAIHLIKRNDSFGDASYYETPGGGIDEGETPEEAFIRESEEEIGWHCEILKELGIVEDAYNRLSRKNINHFYLAKAISPCPKHFVSDGDSLIADTLWADPKELLKWYELNRETPIGRLVYNRETPMLLEALAHLGLN